jgi:hypothetical protein
MLSFMSDRSRDPSTRGPFRMRGPWVLVLHLGQDRTATQLIALVERVGGGGRPTAPR